MIRDQRMMYDLYCWDKIGKVTVQPSTIPNAGNGVFATHSFKVHDIIAFFDGTIMPYDPLYGNAPEQSYDLQLGEIDGGVYICRGHRYIDAKAYSKHRLDKKYKSKITEGNKRAEKKYRLDVNDKYDRCFNIAQLCNDSRDKRINAEIMCCDTNLIPDEWQGLSTNSARFEKDGVVRFVYLPVTAAIYAVRDIACDDEVFTSYGTTYWDTPKLK